MKRLLGLILGLLLLPAVTLAATSVPWTLTNLTDAFIFPSLVNGGSKGIQVTASSTIGSGSQTGGLTVSGGSTTTLNAYIAGNLGVNIPAPQGVIHGVSATAANTAIFERSGLNTNNSFLAVRVLATKINAMGDGFGSGFGFDVQDDDGVINLIGLVAGIRDGADDTGAISFRPGTAGVFNERMRIMAGGNVGIGLGTTSPWALLSLNVNNIVGPAFFVGSTTASAFIVTNGNNVGINTYKPQTKLEVVGTASSTDVVVSSAAGTPGCATFSSIGQLSNTGVSCGTGGGGAFPFTPVTYGTQNVNATSTGIWFTGTPLSVIASSSFTTFASTTQFSNSGNTWFPSLTSGTLNVDGAGLVYKTATSTATIGTGLTYTGTWGQFIAGVSGTLNNTGLISATCTGGTTCSGTNPILINSFSYPFPGNATGTTITFNQGLVSVGSTTINGNATTTGTFFATIASSSQLFGSGLTTCNGANQALNWAAGVFGCVTITSSGGSFPFTPTNNYGVNTSATSTPLWARLGIFASSTSHFDQIDVGSTTNSGMSTSTFFGNVLVGGMLGVATTSPWAQFSVDTSTLLTGIPSFVVGSSSRTDFVINQLGNVGIGIATPQVKLHVSRDGVPAAAGLFTGVEAFMGTANTNLNFRLVGASASFGSGFVLLRTRGTVDSPTIVQDGDSLGFLTYQGYDGTLRRNATQIESFVDGTPGSGDMPGRITFQTSPDGTVALAERMRITNQGLVAIGTTSPGTLFDLFSTASTTQRVDSNGLFRGGQILIKDADGIGYTCLYANNGTVVSKIAASPTTC